MKALPLEKLASDNERDILRLHGMGPSPIPKLRRALQESGLKFKLR